MLVRSGLTDNASSFPYRVEACTGTFSGDVPGLICDSVGEFDTTSGTWNLVFDAADPALAIDPLVCKGFWDGGDCDATTPIDVSVGSATADDNPSILALPQRPAAPLGPRSSRRPHIGMFLAAQVALASAMHALWKDHRSRSQSAGVLRPRCGRRDGSIR